MKFAVSVFTWLSCFIVAHGAVAQDAAYDADVGVSDAGSYDAGTADVGLSNVGAPDAGEEEQDTESQEGDGEESAPEAPSGEDELDELDEMPAVDMDALAEEAAEEVSEEIAEETGDDDLLDEDSLRVDTVLISADEIARVGGAATRIDEEALEALEYDDPNSVLQQVPAVFIRREDGFGLRPNIGIRGANSERSKKITLMEDGILFAPAPYSAPAAYYFPVASRMTGVEIYKGPSAIRFGPHTVGGAINWITRSIPADESAGVDLNFGSYGTGKLHGYYGKSWDHVGFLIEGVQWQPNGYKEFNRGPSDNTGFNKSELMGKLRLNSDLAASVYHALRVKLGYSREVSNETYLGLTDTDFATDPNFRYVASKLDQMKWWRGQGELRYRLEVGNDFDLSVTGYRHDFDRAWRKLNDFANPSISLASVVSNPTGARGVYYDILRGNTDSSSAEEELLIGTNDRRFVSQGVDANANYRIFGDSFENELRFGARVHHDRIRRLHTEETFMMESAQLFVADDAAEPIVTTENIGRTTAYSAYLLDELSFWRLTLTPGIRAEFVDGELENLETDEVTPNFQTAVLPGLGAFLELTDDFGALAGVHRGFSPVSPGQPENVTPELSTNYEAGVRFSRPATRSLVEVVGFFNDYRNLLGECTFSAGCDEEQVDDQFNAGEVWVYGLEAVGGHQLELPAKINLPLHLAYTLTESQFRTGFDSANPQFGRVDVGDELPYVPAHQLSLRLGFHREELAFNAVGTYVHPMRELAGQNPDDLRTDAQYFVDLLLSYELIDGFDLYGKIDNVLNQRPIVSRRPYGARPSRPFLIQAGVRWEL